MYVYLFTRNDISPAQVAVQSAHAAHHSGDKYGAPKNCNLVLLGVEREAFTSIESQLVGLGIKYIKFFEPDINDFTAFATEPIEHNKAFKKYQLYK